MAIELRESFKVRAPVAAVWQFLLDPHQVVLCMPGAELEEVLGDHTFVGNIRVKVGPITATYKGRVRFVEVDESEHRIRMAAEGLEAGGGTARGEMSSRLIAAPDGSTEIVAEASAEITGRIAQFGRGMVEGVSQELFRRFAGSVTELLEAPQAEAEMLAAKDRGPIRVIPLLITYLWSVLVRFSRRLLRRKKAERTP